MLRDFEYQFQPTNSDYKLLLCHHQLELPHCIICISYFPNSLDHFVLPCLKVVNYTICLDNKLEDWKRKRKFQLINKERYKGKKFYKKSKGSKIGLCKSSLFVNFEIAQINKSTLGMKDLGKIRRSQEEKDRLLKASFKVIFYSLYFL